MKKIFLLGAILGLYTATYSQSSKDKTLFKINKQEIKVSEFKRVYEKNLEAIDDKESKDVKNNLELFIDYKLKVAEAFELKLDTLKTYKREMETYKNQLSAPYLQDKSLVDNMIKDAYYRTKNEIKAKHILIRSSAQDSPKDTVIAFNRISSIRQRILDGEDFEKVANETSEDNSARDDASTNRKGNNGNLGYFSAFQMVYPFEDAAYNTKVGDVSKPFKTRFGYHIIQVDDIRPSKGKVEVAHVLITDVNSGATKIKEVYAKLLKGEQFEDLAKKYSNDNQSKLKGGKLNPFGSGRMVKPFEDVSFSLKEAGDVSKPFKTRFGWHIVKLIKKHPVPTLKALESELRRKVSKSGGNQLSKEAIISKLKKKYTIVENDDAKKIIKDKNIRGLHIDSLQQTLFSINERNFKQYEFVKYLKSRRDKPTFFLYDAFKKEQIIQYYKDNLIHTEPEYANTLKEYKDGLLLFELLQQKIWDKSTKDTLGLQTYFDKNIDKYKSKELEKVKGQVINDYQHYLEKNWVADLRKKNKVKVKKSVVKQLIKFYNKD